MPRLALAVLLSGLLARGASGQPVSEEFPTEGMVRGQASLFVGELCKSAPAACPAARRLLDDYKAAMEATGSCTREACEPERLKELSKKLQQLDEEEHMLPYFEGREDRPLLRLSVLASARLAAAGVVAGHPEAARMPHYRANQAEKVVEAICLKDAGSCASARAILSEDREIKAFIAECTERTCSFETLEPPFIRAQYSMNSYLRYRGKEQLSIPALPLFSLLDDSTDGLASLIAAAVQSNVTQLRSGLATAEARGDGAPDTKALEDLYRRSAIGTNRLDAALGSERAAEVSARREEVNALAAKLASLKARRKAEELADSLGGSNAALAVAPGGAPAAAAGVPVSAVPYRKLDGRATPSPIKPALPAPDILAEPPTALQLLKNAFSKDPVIQTDALRRLGLTSTVGEPGRLAPLAYRQAASDTCAVASQVQVLRARGLLPEGDPREQEKVLADEADRRGFFDAGTPTAYSGSLLIEKGVLVGKHAGADWSQLEAAVARGSLVVAGVDARFFWDVKSESRLGHSVLVTGAELSKMSGKILGVYINDSGTDPPGAGRFIPAALFRQAWEGPGGNFVEVHR